MKEAQSIIESFEEVVSRSSGSCALRWKDGWWSYAELNARSNRLAHLLIKNDVRLESPVGVFSLRSPQALVAFIAILKAGGAYVPLDPTYPADRIKYIIQDADIKLILADPNEIKRVPITDSKVIPIDFDAVLDEPVTNPPCKTGLACLAQLFYTSGSTGFPKGVMIEHRGVLRLAKPIDHIDVGPGETLLQFTPLNYDVSTFEMWVTWLRGACLAVPSPGLNSLHEIGMALREFQVSLFLVPSSLLPSLLEHEIESFASVRQLMVGGDVLLPLHAEQFLKRYPDSRLINAYGPTESTVITTVHQIKLEQPMPSRLSIGRPIPGSDVLIMDENLNPVPIGQEGEILITGAGLARGYLNQPELTRKCFIKVTNEKGEQVRAFRSGDFGRCNLDGTVDFLGRKDDQVKINGIRIELGEVRSILISHPAVTEAEVIMVEENANKCLKVFAVLKPGLEVDEWAMLKFLEQKVPGNWRPSALYILPKLPRGPGGKVDRLALRESIRNNSNCEKMIGDSDFVDDLERGIWKIWKETLPITKIGRKDRYVDLGGDSLSALRMIAKVEKMVGRRIGLRSLLMGGTIADIAAAARENTPVSAPPLMLCVQTGQPRQALPPLFFAHGDYEVGGLYCQKMAQKLGSHQPLYALTPQGTFGGQLPASLEEAGDNYLKLIRSVQPKGPYYLGGYCNGSLVMYEVAQQLVRIGESVPVLILLDPPDHHFFQTQQSLARIGKLVGLPERLGRKVYKFLAESLQIRDEFGTCRLIREFFNMLALKLPLKIHKRLSKLARAGSTTDLNLHHDDLLSRYERKPFSPSIAAWIFLRARDGHAPQTQVNYWSKFIPNVHFELIPGNHWDLQKYMGEIAKLIRSALVQVDRQGKAGATGEAEPPMRHINRAVIDPLNPSISKPQINHYGEVSTG